MKVNQLYQLYKNYPAHVRKAIDNIARRANTPKENVIAAYMKAARDAAVNATSLFLK